VNFFAFLLLNDRILTYEVMQIRGMSCELRCVMCDAYPLETSHHLFFDCPNAREIWQRFPKLIQLQETVQSTWRASCSYFCHFTGKKKHDWATAFIAVLWFLWKQRNEAIFRGVKMPTGLVINKAREEGGLWARFCNRGAFQKIFAETHN
jgi:hypothetical protein